MASAVADTFGVLAAMAEVVVPFMAIGYVLLAAVTLVIHAADLPRVLADDERQRQAGEVPVFRAEDHANLRIDPGSWPAAELLSRG